MIRASHPDQSLSSSWLDLNRCLLVSISHGTPTFPTGKRWSVGKRKGAIRQSPVAPLICRQPKLYQAQSFWVAKIGLDLSLERKSNLSCRPTLDFSKNVGQILPRHDRSQFQPARWGPYAGRGWIGLTWGSCYFISVGMDADIKIPMKIDKLAA